MKTKYLILPLAAALSVPALAQTQTQPQSTDSQSQTQSQPAGLQSSSASQSTTDSGRQPIELQRKEGFWGHLNPFARKKYVQRQMTPVVGRVNELDELTAANSKMIKDVDSRASEGIRLASAKANEADQHALDAGNRAQQANQIATQATQRLTSVEQTVNNIDQYQTATEAEIRFRPGQSTLSSKAKEALDQIAEPLKDQKGYVVEVQGFSSGKGAAAVENSRRMAESVVRYLVLEHQIPVYRIYTVGMGNAPLKAADGAKAKRISGGRVEIALLKNGIADLGTQQAQSGQAGVAGNGSANASSSTLPQSDQPAATSVPSQQQMKQQQLDNQVPPKSVEPATQHPAPVPANSTDVPKTENPKL